MPTPITFLQSATTLLNKNPYITAFSLSVTNNKQAKIMEIYLGNSELMYLVSHEHNIDFLLLLAAIHGEI